MKISSSAILIVAFAAQVTVAVPFWWSKKNTNRTGSLPSHTLPEGTEFFAAPKNGPRKQQFEQYGVCKLWYGQSEGCSTVFPQSCGVRSSYCGKTKEDCGSVSEGAKYFYCDIFHTEEDRYYKLAHLLHREVSQFWEVKHNISEVASSLCSATGLDQVDCPSTFTPCGDYCAMSEEVCNRKNETLSDLSGQKLYSWYLRLTTITCDNYPSVGNLHVKQSRSDE